MPTTADVPKCYAEVDDRRILDWVVDAFQRNGVDDVCFIGGYQIDKVRRDYPDFVFRHNDNWPDNNILASFFYAEDLMDRPFICCYSDCLFSSQSIASLLDAEGDISLLVDTAWIHRFGERSEHPTDDAEKVTVHNGHVTRIHREIAEEDAYGEYIGVAKFTADGAARLREHYHRCRESHAGRPWREAKVFEKAYLIHLFQEMLEAGEAMTHVDTPGGYIEIDTQQDFDYARTHWTARHADK
jgi:choline kinase